MRDGERQPLVPSVPERRFGEKDRQMGGREKQRDRNVKKEKKRRTEAGKSERNRRRTMQAQK